MEKLTIELSLEACVKLGVEGRRGVSHWRCVFLSRPAHLSDPLILMVAVMLIDQISKCSSSDGPFGSTRHDDPARAEPSRGGQFLQGPLSAPSWESPASPLDGINL